MLGAAACLGAFEALGVGLVGREDLESITLVDVELWPYEVDLP